MEDDKMEHKVKMTSAEMGLLWTAYMNDSMAICMLHHFLQNIEDADTRVILEHAQAISQKHMQTIIQFLNQEKFPIPQGFNSDDVIPSAPRLFADSFYLAYIDGMSMLAMVTFTAASCMATRLDLRKYFNACCMESIELHNRSLDLLLNKGLFVRPPFISVPDNVDFVDNRNYLTGFFGKRRHLNAIEITNIYLNIQRNTLGKALIMAFAQIAQSQEVLKYMERGKDISTKHIKIFSDLLLREDLPAPMTHDHNVLNSTEKIFSDKLLMFHVTALTGASIGNYGIGIGTSPRRDLGLTFTRLLGEVALYAEDGAEIMIDNAWLEEPPQADDRAALARQQ